MKLKLISLFFVIPFTALAATEQQCAPNPLQQLVKNGHDLYLGELHGTQEVPALIQCLTTEALKNKKEPLIVSLELPDDARNLQSEFWYETDGRSSQAMWSLVQFLIDREKERKLSFYFQYDDDLNRAVRNGGQNQSDEMIGRKLNELAQKGQLIALGGNFHSMKEPAEYAPNLKPAGMFSGSTVMHIALMQRKGTAWACLGDTCGIQTVNQPLQKIGILVDGKEMHHDYLYLMEKATASPPKFSK